MNPSFVLQWLRELGFKEIETIEKKHRENDYEGVVFVDEMQFKELLNPINEGQHPIDKKRMDILSNIWDHLETDNSMII